MIGVEGRAVDRLLQVPAVVHDAEEERSLPLVLAVAAGRPERQTRLAVPQGEAGGQRGAGPLARRERHGRALVEPEHLAPGAEAEAELSDHRRGLQPAARRGRRHQVAPAVDHVEVAGVAAGGPATPTGCATDEATPTGRRGLHRRREAGRPGRWRRPRPAVRRSRTRPGRSSCDAPSPISAPALGVVGGRQQRVERHVDEGRVGVEHVPVGVGQLGASVTTWTKSAPSGSRPSRSNPSSRASDCSSTGPWRPGPALADV